MTKRTILGYQTMIQTAFGPRAVVRRVGRAAEYYFTAPTKSAPNGEWRVFNGQRGFVPVPSNARGLVLACQEAGVSP